jgi:uncharacterized protein with HEPN domain
VSEARSAAIGRLHHMIEAAHAIEAYTARGRNAFDADTAIQDAILYQIIVLGEAAKSVAKADADLTNELSEVEWSLLAKMRDRVAHRYWETDRELVWATATKDIPELSATLSDAITRLARSV